MRYEDGERLRPCAGRSSKVQRAGRYAQIRASPAVVQASSDIGRRGRERSGKGGLIGHAAKRLLHAPQRRGTEAGDHENQHEADLLDHRKAHTAKVSHTRGLRQGCVGL